MKQAKLPLYIRIGELPENDNSAVHRGDQVVRNEGGISVWKAVEVDNRYYPVLPKHPNENTIADYFDHLLNSDDPVYLVTGTEIFIEGADREPLLMDVKIIKDITDYYRLTSNVKKKFKARITSEVFNKLIKDGKISKEDVKEYGKEYGQI